jgi:CHAT domain-containing protein/Tfp pilus assembly protein PilF
MMNRYTRFPSSGLLVLLLLLAFFPSPVFAAPPVQEQDPKAKADALYQEGSLLLQKADYAEALTRLEAALRIYRGLGSRADEGAVLNQIGRAHRRMGHYARALEFFQQSLSIWQETDDQFSEAITLNNIALAYVGLGKYTQALEYLQQALALKQKTGDELSIARTLSNIGEVYLNLGQSSQALEYFQQALTVQKKDRDASLDLSLLNNSGSAYRSLGQYSQALTAYSLALTIAQQTGDLAWEGVILNNTGEVYRTLGQYAQALDYYQRALEIAQQIGDQAGEATRLTNMGELYLSQADSPEKLLLALGYLRGALGTSREIGQRGREVTILADTGATYRAMGEYTKALDDYQQALAIAKEIGDRIEEGTTLSNLGEIYIALEKYPQALDSLQQALAITRETGDRTQEEITLSNIGFAYEQQGDVAEAIRSYKQSIDVTESVQNEIKIDELKASFVAEQTGTYEHVIGLLWDEGRFPEAFNYAERARARAFLDQLARGAVDFQAGSDATLLEKERVLKSELASLRTQLINLNGRPQEEWDPQTIAALQAELIHRENDYAQLLTEIKIQSPEAVSLISVDVASLSDIQAELDPGTTLIEYFVTGHRTLIFIITRNTFETKAVPVGQSELSAAITSFREFVSLDNPHPDTLKQLYTWLIAPIRDKLNTPVLGIVPHRVLHYIPFAALTDGTQYLNQIYSLFTLPSASTLRFVREKRKPAPHTIMALGNPTITEPGLTPLQFAKQEAEFAASLYGTHAWIGADATETMMRARAKNAGILHLAVHGEYDPGNPLFSRLYLAEDSENDGLLEVHEIYGLDLTRATDLVVLSACQTNTGAISAGDEVVGLNRAFLYAGTPTVMASLWNVDDAATALLMQRFYTHLREGMSKAMALQQAQSEVREHYPHPYYWAAFVLTGDPGSAAGVTPADALVRSRGALRAVGIVVVLLLLTAGSILIRRSQKEALL